MNKLRVNQDMLALLRQATGPAEIRDESGTLVGVFSPVEDCTQGPVRRKVRTPEEEAALLAELERREKDPRPDHTFLQAFERLLSLATEPSQRALIQEKIDLLKE